MVKMGCEIGFGFFSAFSDWFLGRLYNRIFSQGYGLDMVFGQGCSKGYSISKSFGVSTQYGILDLYGQASDILLNPTRKRGDKMRNKQAQFMKSRGVSGIGPTYLFEVPEFNLEALEFVFRADLFSHKVIGFVLLQGYSGLSALGVLDATPPG